MVLDEKLWIYGGGASGEWTRVWRRRLSQSLCRLRRISEEFRARAPASLRGRGYEAGLGYFLRVRDRLRDRLATHPAFDYWLHLWDKHFDAPCSERDWRLQFGLFQSFPASLALARKDPLRLEAALDPAARFHFYGTPLALEFPEGMACSPLWLTARAGRLSYSAAGPGRAWRTIHPTAPVPAGGLRVGPATLRHLPEIIPGLFYDDSGWLLVHGVTMHGLERLDEHGRERFVSVLRRALSDLEERAPALHGEMTDMLHALIPLKNPKEFGSVSSSYATLRGAICLSHAQDPLLQAETLIHEFCHQKMNQLLSVDPLLLPGQSGQVFYSPWRDDARRLRGLLLGAHAFLNVARYLSRSISRETYETEDLIEVMVNIARRLYQVETALRSLCGYGSFTEFGRRFVLGMCQELMLLFHEALWFPPALLKEQRDLCEAHLRDFSLPGTGFHKTPDLVDKVRRVPFLTPEDDRAPLAAALQ